LVTPDCILKDVIRLSDWDKRERRLDDLDDLGRRISEVEKEIAELRKDIQRRPFWWWRPLTADQRRRIEKIRRELEDIEGVKERATGQALLDQIKRLEFRRHRI
jgi:DNA repair exonuclease SbcCD ATPase subunit